MTGPLETAALLGMGTIAAGSLAVIFGGTLPRRRYDPHDDLPAQRPAPPRRAALPCPSCGDDMSAVAHGNDPQSALARTSCAGCGLRLIGVIDQPGQPPVWFPMPSL